MSKKKNGAVLLCETLESLGIDTVFSIPGTQNLDIFEALRQSPLQVISPSNESTAAFMANGYYRSSGKVATLITIPGPGFTYALSGIAEAKLDSAAILFFYVKPVYKKGNRFRNQEIDEIAIARPLVKQVFEANTPAEIPSVTADAFSAALGGEPGPVLIALDADALTDSAAAQTSLSLPEYPAADDNTLAHYQQIAAAIADARHPLLFTGQGAFAAADAVRQFSERHQIPVITTSSGRGVVPEDHELALPLGFMKRCGNTLNETLAGSDLILALGCKMSANAVGGFRLQLPKERLIHVDACAKVVGANYPARIELQSDIRPLANFLINKSTTLQGYRSSWQNSDLAKIRHQAEQEKSGQYVESKVIGMQPNTLEAFFSKLNEITGPQAILVTDTGLHQFAARRHYCVRQPRGFIFPSNFQSMGYGLPAALGAKIANPDRPVIALIGDGSFGISGLELLTATRDQIPVITIVFNDGHFGIIRLNQMIDFGHPHRVDLGALDFAKFAESVGVDYYLLENNLEEILRTALASKKSSIIEVRLSDSSKMTVAGAKGKAKTVLKKLTGR